MKLLIVESPSKAKTITKYLDGKYTVRASVGHVRDLPKSNKDAIDIPNGFIPHYEISPGKEKVVAEIKTLAEKSEEILLATDPDREGEAIAWHIAQAIRLERNKKPASSAGRQETRNKQNDTDIKRIVFHEITKEAVQEAMKHPRDIDKKLVKAQEARRVLDRLFGYDLSGLIWKKVRYGLSAGRVQSPALRIIMEREREIRAFTPEKFWTILANLKAEDGSKLTFTCAKEPRDKKEVDRIISAGKKEDWKVFDVKETEIKRSPRAPFITSTLQQTASSRLGLSPSQTMRIAQQLYEAGLITYMRTDSTTLSSQAQNQIAKTIEKNFSKDLYQFRKYSRKSKNAQEAHEAIRPTDCTNQNAGDTPDQKKLYRLIWQRTVSSQMVDAKVLRTRISANIISKSIPDFIINGSRTLFDGWLLVDSAAKSEDVQLPKISVGDFLKFISIDSTEKETQPPSRYSEAGLVKELEKRGIGRPSTYATIIKTIQDRGYVEKINKALHPTDTGDVVSSFLEKEFEKYISDSFTAEMENNLDSIAEGKAEYEKILKDFYTPFTKEIKSKKDTKKITDLGKVDEKFKCPVCGAPMVWKLGKNGKFMSCSKFPECTGARTEEGKEMEGPKETGEKCPQCAGALVTREGKFGKFISCSNFPKCKFIKEDPIEAAKRKTGVKCPECQKGEMMERKGRFGIFYACSNYPTCRYAIKAKPTGKKCPLCGKLMMEGTKTIPERCSDKNCPNHRPDKIKN